MECTDEVQIESMQAPAFVQQRIEATLVATGTHCDRPVLHP